MKKEVTSASKWARLEYDEARRTLRFVGSYGGPCVTFKCVPPELFYGAPSGKNLENFFTLKVYGRFEMEVETKPPTITLSMWKKEWTVTWPDGESHTWAVEPGDPTIVPLDPRAAYDLHLATYAKKLTKEKTAAPQTQQETSTPDDDES